MTVTGPAGFRAAGVAAGLKAGGGRDLALVVNDGPARPAAGVFTTNRVQAAPVLWSRQVLAGGRVHAVLLNSGGANAATGPAGFADAHASAEAVAAALAAGDVSAGEVALASTGLIGTRLDMAAVRSGVALAADAIRTTDTVPKTVDIAGDGFRVGGMAKGAGMLAPSLATMLAVLTTDAVAEAATLDRVLRTAAAATFDRVDGDGAQSTNDTVLLLASAASGVAPDPAALHAAVLDACTALAAALVADAEGATKRVLVDVTGAVSTGDALLVARRIARDPLVKTALHGSDPNWGRVLAAVGTTAAVFDPDRVDIAMNGVPVCRGGAAGADRRLADLSGTDITVRVDLHAGSAGGHVWTTDLSAGYVHENSAYST